MIYTQKLLPYLFFPLTITLFILLFSLRNKSRALICIAISFLVLCSLPITSIALSKLLEHGHIYIDVNDTNAADSVLVLSGFLSRTKTSQGSKLEWGNASRFFAGIEIFKQQKAKTIIFTNEHLPWMNDKESTGNFLSAYAQQLGIPKSSILITKNVQNTEEEALAVKELSGAHNINSLILVTSAFHMSRAKFQFENLGFQVTAYPVDFLVNTDTLTPMDFLPSASALSLTELAIKEFLARGYYKLKKFLT